MAKRTETTLTVVGDDVVDHHQAITDLKAKIAAGEAGIADLRAQLEHEEAWRERAEEEARQRVEEARQERLREKVAVRIVAAEQVENAITVLNEALVTYVAAAAPIRAELRHDERGHHGAIQAGQTRLAARLQAILRQHEIEPVSFRRDETSLQEKEREALDWWQSEDEGPAEAA